MVVYWRFTMQESKTSPYTNKKLCTSWKGKSFPHSLGFSPKGQQFPRRVRLPTFSHMATRRLPRGLKGYPLEVGPLSRKRHRHSTSCFFLSQRSDRFSSVKQTTTKKRCFLKVFRDPNFLNGMLEVANFAGIWMFTKNSYMAL